MTQKNAGNMKLIVSALTLCLVAQQSLNAQASAGMISGITPEIINGNKVYNIDPSVLNGDIGFRLYEEFKLDKGEIANLIFKYGEKNVEKFVNLVDNTIDINGLVNTMRDGKFHNGHAIFVSPKGMVVGASGVLNVGSLTVLTPDQNKFDKFKSDYDIRNDLSDLYSQGKGTVTVNGKVIARDAVDIRAAAVNINNTIMSGVKNNDLVNTNSQADILFNNLVNTDNLKAGNSFANDSGSIKVTAYAGNSGVNIAKGSTLKNFGKGNIEVTSYGTKGIVADGDIKNPNGNVLLTTINGTINVNGNVINQNGDIIADSADGIVLAQAAKMQNTNGNTTLKNVGTTGIEVKGTITNKDGNLTFDNSAEGGIKIDGAPISNTNGDLYMTNTGAGGITINGTIANENGNSEYKNEAGQFSINGNVSNKGKYMDIANTGDGLNLANGARIANEGKLTMSNTGLAGMLLDGTIENSKGNAEFTNNGGQLRVNGTINNADNEVHMFNDGDGGMIVNGKIDNKGTLLTMHNEKGALKINETGVIDNANDIEIENYGNEGLHIAGTVNNGGNSNIKNSGTGALSISGEYTNGKNFTANNSGQKGFSISGIVKNKNGNVDLSNEKAALSISGNVENENGNLSAVNIGDGGMIVNGTISNLNGNSTYTNEAGQLLVNGTVSNAGGETNITNRGTDIRVTEKGVINSDGALKMLNYGEKGINIEGLMNVQNGDAYIFNEGEKGITLASSGKITNKTDLVNIVNTGEKGIKVQGLIKGNGVDITSTNSDVVIGDDTVNDNYITSNGDININIDNGNLYNYGVDKTLLVTENGGNLNIETLDGNIGKDAGHKTAVSTGVDPDSRDFTKSINVKIDGAVTAKALQQRNKSDDLTVNIASKGADLKVDQIKADGKVILTAADFDKDGKGYDILNASTDNTKANVEGKGISIIASGNVGQKENKLTFNQTHGKFNKDGYNIDKLTYSPNAEYGMDVLAINDINIKGQDDAYDTHITTMISREGSIDAEFSGNTYIREVTADKGLNLVTRGAEFVIDNLGVVPFTPVDYFGENGNIAPSEVIVKALDINPNTRVDNAGLVDGIHSHWANSNIIVKNGRVDDNAKIVFTGDNVYAGGYRFYMGKERNEDGKTYWVYDDRTAMTDMSGNGPTIRVNAVREDDVTSIGRKEEERNYYTGGSVQDELPWYGDDDDDDDDDHLIVPEPGDDDDDDDGPTPPPGDDDDDDDDGPTPPPGDDDDDDDDGPTPPPGDDDDDDDDGPTPPPGDDDDDDDGPTPPPGDDDDDDDGPTPPPSGDDDDDTPPATMDDAKRTLKKEYSENLSFVDKRQYMRFRVDENNLPVRLDATNKISSVVDISRGGMAVRHNNSLKAGEVIPVRISYGDIDINADVKIVTANNSRAGAEFVNLDNATANRILYLNLLLEEEQMLSLSAKDKQI